MDFDPKLHQKVTYFGQDNHLRKSHLYVVIKEEFPNFYAMKPDEQVVIHIMNRFNQIIHNSEPQIRNSYIVLKDDLKLEGDLYEPNAWSE